MTKEYKSRQNDLRAYRDFRRLTWKRLTGSRDSPGVSVILGSPTGFPKKKGSRTAHSEIQSLRFDKDYFTKSRARAWLHFHGFKTAIGAD